MALLQIFFGNPRPSATSCQLFVIIRMLSCGSGKNQGLVHIKTGLSHFRPLQC